MAEDGRSQVGRLQGMSDISGTTHPVYCPGCGRRHDEERCPGCNTHREAGTRLDGPKRSVGGSFGPSGGGGY